VPVGGKQRRPIDGCVTAIARFCDCKVWVSRDTGKPNYVFFGFEVDTALASYLFDVIDRAMRTELTRFRGANAPIRVPYCTGAVTPSGNAPRVCVPQAAQRQLCPRCSVTISGLGSLVPADQTPAARRARSSSPHSRVHRTPHRPQDQSWHRVFQTRRSLSPGWAV
jgi:hypothetical protein